MSEKIDSQKAPEPVGLYPHARRVGNLLFFKRRGPARARFQKNSGRGTGRKRKHHPLRHCRTMPQRFPQREIYLGRSRQFLR